MSTGGYWPNWYWPGAVRPATAGRGFARLRTITASTERAPALASGKRGAMAANLASLKVTPLDPIDAELRQRLGLNTPHELLQCFCDGDQDVVEGDVLVVSTSRYPIRAVEDWDWILSGVTFQRLILEDLKR